MLRVSLVDKTEHDVIISFYSEKEQIAFVQWLLIKETEENWKKYWEEYERLPLSFAN